MKKFALINSIIALMILFSSCEDYQAIMDDLEEINDANKAEQLANVDKVPSVAAYSLVDADYELSTNEDVAEFKNFSSSATAEDHLGPILDIKFLGRKGDQMAVTYTYYRGSNDNTKYIEDPVEHELVDADYDAMGTGEDEPGEYNNFSDYINPADFIPDWMDVTYPSAVDGENMKILYEYYAGSTTTRYHLFYRLDGAWHIVDVTTYELSSDDYDSMGDGPGKYNNFSSSDLPEDYLPTFLAINYPYAVKGETIVIMYKYYSGGTTVEAGEYFFDGMDWEEYQSTIPTTSPFKFSNGNWVIVPPITYVLTTDDHNKEYTLTDDDYAAVGNGTYYNFDDPDEVEGKIITILKMSIDDAVPGVDVYKVYYKFYSGSVDVLTMNFAAILE